jgi:hypothetical protein
MKESASVIEVRDASSQCEIGLLGSTDWASYLCIEFIHGLPKCCGALPKNDG